MLGADMIHDCIFECNLSGNHDLEDSHTPQGLKLSLGAFLVLYCVIDVPFKDQEYFNKMYWKRSW